MNKPITYFIFLLLASLNASGQNYALFNSTSKKLFTDDPLTGSTFSITFDTVTSVGTDSVFYNHTGLGQEIESDTCVFWGGSWCIQQNKPSWLGFNIIYDNNGHYKFITNQNDTLFFNFDHSTGDSSLFYQDLTQQFYLVAQGADTMTALGFPDSVRSHRIAHTDLSGNTIHSLLNDEKIIVGKQLGLIDFFRIDSFPQILQPLTLLGNRSPDAGFFQLTNEMIYDHQPGDEIQYLERFFHEGGPPWENYHRYTKHHFIERTDIQDSIIYLIARSTFEADSATEVLDTIALRFKRNEVLAVLPFDVIDQSDQLRTKKLYKAGYCDFDLWTYSITPGYLIYCREDNCWGPYDIPGPPPDEEKIYVCGLGLYSDKSSVISPPPWGYWYEKEIIYFKKNGITCGDDLVVQMNDPSQHQDHFKLFPNPVQNNLTIQTDLRSENILIINNINGQEQSRTAIIDPLTTIDVESWKSGIYVARFVDGNSVAVTKIIKL